MHATYTAKREMPLVGKTTRKRSLARLRRSWQHNNKIYVEVRWEDVDWIYLAYDRDNKRALRSRVINVRGL